MKHIALLVLLVLLCPLASADNVTIYVHENSDGVYFISVNDGGLIQCDGTKCTVDITNRTSAFTLSNEDIKAIARQTSAEIETIGSGDLSELRLTEVIAASDKESYETFKAYIERTWMKSTVEYNNCTVELTEKKGALAALDAKFAGYDAEIKSYQERIESKDRDISLYWGLVVVLTLTVFIMFVARSDLIATVREWKQK